jgi:acyl transferase domain-containing protein
VLSGDPEALDTLGRSLSEDGLFCRRINVDYASHGPEVDPLRPALVAALAQLRPAAGRVPIHSTAFDRVVDGSEFDGTYWADNLRRPVHLSAAMCAALAGSDRTLFVELSAHPILVSAVEDCVEAEGAEAITVHSHANDESAWVTMLTALGTAFSYGCPLDWRQVYPGGRYVPLPGYPWQGKRFWVEHTPQDKPGISLDVVPAPERPVGAPQPPDDTIAQRIAHRAAEVLALSPDEIDPDLPLSVAGLDSVLAVRLRARMKQELRLHLPTRHYLGRLSLVDLTRLARPVPAEP